MGIDTGVYKLVKTLHILTAIIGFGTVFLNGIYGDAMKKKRGPEAAFMGHTVEKVGNIAEYFIYAVPVFGLAALGMSDGVWKFSQTWVWLALTIYVVALGLSHSQLLPNVKRMNALMDELAAMGPPPVGAPAGPPPQAVELEERGKKQAVVSTVLNLMMVVILFLMVFKPGL